MAPCHIFITSDLGMEAALVAIPRFLIPGPLVRYANIKMNVIRNNDTLVKTVQSLLDHEEKKEQKPDDIRLSLIGDFWGEESFAALYKVYPEVEVQNYKFNGEIWWSHLDGIRMRSETTHKTTCKVKSSLGFLMMRVQDAIGNPPSTAAFMLQHCKALDLLASRCQNERTAETQPFVSGLCNIDVPTSEKETDGINLANRMFMLFNGLFTFEEVIKIGTAIAASQTEVARERAMKNARCGTFTDGTSYVVTEGPEFVNLTHDQLHERYPNQKVTIVCNLKFVYGEPDVLAHSLRSWSGDVDVLQIVKEHGGGGSAAAAGTKHFVDTRIVY